MARTDELMNYQASGLVSHGSEGKGPQNVSSRVDSGL